MMFRPALAALALTGAAAVSLAACGSGATSSATAAASSAKAAASTAASAASGGASMAASAASGAASTASSAAAKASEAVESAKPSGSASASGSYTMQDVQQHATAGDCWAVVSNNVYNLTAWENEHPGGAQRIIDLCGTDATQAFNKQHGGQSEPEQELADFKIGTLSS